MKSLKIKLSQTKILFFLLSITLILSLVYPINRVFASTIDDSCATIQDGGYYLDYATSDQEIGQEFIPSQTGDLDHITIDIQKMGSPTGNIFIKIYSNSSGQPGTLLYTSQNVAQSTLSSSLSYVDVPFNSGATLTGGTTYWLVIGDDHGVDSSNFDQLGATSPDCHADGLDYNGSSWSDLVSGYSPIFKEYNTSNLDLGDKTSNGNDLTNSGAIGSTDTPYSGSIKSANFDASNNACLEGTSTSALEPTGNFTIETWVKFTTMPGSLNYPKLFQSYSESSNVAGIALGVDGDVNKAFLIVGKDTGNSSGIGTDWQHLYGSTVLTTGTWYHIAGVYNGSTLQLYVNGVSDGSVSWSGNPGYAATNYVRIGCGNESGTNNYFLNGNIDDVRLYNVARTQSEISSDYQNNLIGNESGLEAYYPFESLVSDRVTYYTANDGTNFTRSTSPFSLGSETQTANSDGTVTVNVNGVSSYADSGFAVYEGTLGNLPNFTLSGSGDPYSLNIWFDEDNDNEFFNWNGSGVLTSLGSDTYALGPSSSSGTDAITGSSSFYLESDGQNHTLSDFKSGNVSGISSSTKVAVWVGVSTSSGSTSSTISSLGGL